MNRFDTEIKRIKIKDLLFVVLYGGVLSVLFGILLGFIDYFIGDFIGLSFAGILFLISSMQIGRMVRKQYEFPHIIYIVLTALFLIVQAIIIFFLPYIFTVVKANNAPELVFDFRLYWFVLESFARNLFRSFNFNLWLTVFVFAIGTYIGVKQTY